MSERKIPIRTRKRARKRLGSAYSTNNLILKNLPEIGRFHDIYHWLLNTDRVSFGLTILGFYLGINLLFAFAYMICGGVENMAPGSLQDAFFFSVQTLATIGYGRLVPISNAANALVTIEAGLGLFSMATAASLMFARFTRATAGVRFSENVVVNVFDGKPTMMFRLANERVANINEASVYLVLARQELTAEGEIYRRLYDLKPIRSISPVFELSWTVMHVIDEDSPLCNCTPESVIDSEMTLTVVFTGHHSGFQQRVHERHTYAENQILWDHRFVDLIKRDPGGGSVVIDYANFDKVVAVDEKHRIVMK